MGKRKIAVFAAIRAAFIGVFRHRRILASRAAVPLSVSFILAVIGDFLFAPHEALQLKGQLFSFFASIPPAVFAFYCHRVCLRSALASQPAEAPAGSGTLVRFVGWTLLGVATYSAAAIVSPALAFEDDGSIQPVGPGTSLLNVAIQILTLIIMVRGCLILPMVVSGDPVHPLKAWKLSRGNAWRIFWATTLPLFAMALAFIFLYVAGELPQPGDPAATELELRRVVGHALSQCVGYAIFALEAFILSLIYVRLRGAPTAV